MALINQRTGYYGFTLDGLDGIKSDITGSVKKCIISIAYQLHLIDVDFTISNGTEDWGAQMGDGSIIPLSNPKVLYTNRDNAIVEFDMETEYPANSPCILVYRSDTATFNIKEHIGEERPFTENTLSGHFAFTTEGYNGNVYENGYVNRVMATIPFPLQLADIEFTISAGDDHWGARMGDGSIISLRNPEVVVTNSDNAVVVFEMDIPYPSNSPCIIVYRSSDARYNIKIVTKHEEFVPVENILNVPETITSGVTVDLSPCSVFPSNSTSQGIMWKVISGDAVVDGDFLTILGKGNVVLQGAVSGGATEDGDDFVKDFNITIEENKITILAQPTEKVSLTYGSINGSISINAKSDTGVISYKWYRNHINSITGALEVHNGNKNNYIFPVDITEGKYYYFCEISSPGATTIRTSICEVIVHIALQGIKINPRLSSLEYHGKANLYVYPIPENAKLDLVVWESSNVNVIQVNGDGELYAVASGSATIIAKTSDGRFSDNISINVAEHIPVNRIDNLITEIDSNTEYVLTGTVFPSNATNKNIVWSIIDAGNTGAVIKNGNIIVADMIGSVVVRATIIDGASALTDYIQDITIVVNQKFIPVTDVTVNIPNTIRVGDSLVLTSEIIPSNATNNNVNISIIDPGSTGAILNSGIIKFTNEGKCVIRIMIDKGSSITTDFIKDIELSILPTWVAVDSITGLPERFMDVSSSLQLTASIYPVNASSKEIIYSLESYPEGLKVRLDSGNKLYIDNYKEIVWWEENPNPTPPYYYDKWVEVITDPIVIGIRVPNGIKTGEDYITSIPIGIQSPDSPEIHIPIESIKLELPSIVRARRPILVSKVQKEPWTATNGTVRINFVRANTRQSGFALSFIPSSEPAEYWKEMYNINLDDHYDWTQEGYYMYIFEDIDVVIQYHVENGNADKTAYTSEESIKVLPEYIAVSDISNIPLELPYNSKIQLYPELSTAFNVTKSSTETYDVEIPSYSDVIWTVVSKGSTGATIIDGILSFSSTGTAVIQAEIPNGIHEEFTWYGNEHHAESYIQRFTIKVTGSEKVYNTPIAKLRLNNNDIVNITKISDLYNLSNDKPSNSYIEAGGVRFRKDQVMSIEFWESHTSVDNTKYVEDIILNSNDINTYESIAPTVETLSFDDVVPGTEQDGTILIEDEDSEFNGMRILPDGVFMHYDGTIIRYIENGEAEGEDGEENEIEELILNIKYASDIFKLDPKYIHLPDTFIRYDNGWVSIPAGTILSTNGNLIIPNPEYGADNGDGSKNYDVFPMLYEVSIHGVVFDHTDSRTIMPDGSVIRNSGIIKLPDGYLYDHLTVNFIYDNDDVETDIPLMYGSYLNSDTELCMINGTISRFNDIELRSSNSGNFAELSDGSFIYEDGMVYTVDGMLFDIYGNEISEYINISDNTDIVPINATNQNIKWTITSGPSGTRIIEIPTGAKNTFILVAGNISGRVVLNADIITTSNEKEFTKKFLVNVGDASDLGSELLAINLNGASKNVYKGSYTTKVQFTAELLGTDSDIVNNSIDDIEWEISGNSSSRTKISTSNDKLSATLSISYRESFNNTITVKVTCGNISQTCLVNIFNKFSSNEPYVESLANFARNFSNLTHINHIPQTVNGDDCLRNFMMGCTSFNQSITIPSYIEGDRCLKGFMSNCTSFNQPITIPNGVTGTRCLDRFLSGCISFNQDVLIPEGVTGDYCLMRFLEGCKTFNKRIVIPTDVSGKQCLDHFLFGCTSFNQPITIPDGISGEASMRGFMRDTLKMISTISVSLEAANNCEVNGLTLVCFTRDVAYDTGVPVIGTGAAVFKEKCINMTMTIPLRRLI